MGLPSALYLPFRHKPTVGIQRGVWDGPLFLAGPIRMIRGTVDPWGPLQELHLASARESLESGDPAEAVKWLERALPTPERRALEAEARYRLASELIVKRRFTDAETELRRIPLDPSVNRFLTEERIRLLRVRRATTADLQAMSARFGRACRCSSCLGQDLYTIATCKHQGAGVPAARRLSPTLLAPEVQGAYAAASYRSRWDKRWADPMSQLLRLEKKAVQRPAVRFMGLLLASYVCHHTPLVRAIDALVPVPTSASRAEERGGCIPQELAEAVRDELAIPVRETIRTTGNYYGHQEVWGKARECALRRAWTVKDDPVLRGRTVAVVDDIITTGTTMRTAARMLLENGVGQVFALGLFHTESSGSTG